jgi:hypothetical protein
VAEAMSEERASSWYDDAPITDEQIESVRRDLGLPVAERGAAFAPFVVRKMLAEIDRLRANAEADWRGLTAALNGWNEEAGIAWKSSAEHRQRADEAEQNLRRLRATQPPLADEYGLRITYISTLTEERAIADTLDGALEVLAAFNAKGREGVMSRGLVVRGIEKWRKVEEADRG